MPRMHRPAPIATLTLVALSQLLAAGAPRSASGGAVLVSETFSGNSLPAGWKVDRDGIWSVKDGRLHAVLPDKKQTSSFVRIGSATWRNYSVDLDVCQVRGVDKGFAVRANDDAGVGIDLRGGDLRDVVMYRGYAQLGKAAAPNRAGQWNHLRVEVSGGRYRVYVDRLLKIDYTDRENHLPSGGIALSAYTGGTAECEVLYDNLVVRALP